MDWSEAQTWANFILMKPMILPAGGEIVDLSVRPEAPPGRTKGGDQKEQRPDWTNSNRASHRFEVLSRDGRIRAKQFLYDWAPPAFDHPSLWRSTPKGFDDTADI